MKKLLDIYIKAILIPFSIFSPIKKFFIKVFDKVNFNTFFLVWILFSIIFGITIFDNHGDYGLFVSQVVILFLILYIPIGFIVGFTNKERERRKLKLKKEKEERDSLDDPIREKISLLYGEIQLLELVDTSGFLQKIKDYETDILKFGGDKTLQDFIKIGKFLTNVENLVGEKFNNIPKNLNNKTQLSNFDKFLLESMGKKFETFEESYRKLRKYKLSIESLITYHRELYHISLIFLQLLIKNNRTEFYSIREKFDEIGIFRTGFENEMLSRLDSINNNLGMISNQLNSIRSSLNYQNTLLTVNTFQLKSINKKLG